MPLPRQGGHYHGLVDRRNAAPTLGQRAVKSRASPFSGSPRLIPLVDMSVDDGKRIFVRHMTPLCDKICYAQGEGYDTLNRKGAHFASPGSDRKTPFRDRFADYAKANINTVTSTAFNPSPLPDPITYRSTWARTPVTSIHRPLTPCRLSWGPTELTPGPSYPPPDEGRVPRELPRPRSSGNLGLAESVYSSGAHSASGFSSPLTVSSSLTSRAYSHTLSTHKKKLAKDAMIAASPVLSASRPRSPNALASSFSMDRLESASSLSRATTAENELRETRE